MGLVAVDVKHHKFFKPYRKNISGFTLAVEQEIMPMIEFEGLFRTYLWYAFKNNDDENSPWYFISGYDAAEKGEELPSPDGGRFLFIEKKYFKTLNTADDFGVLFSARIGVTGRITRALERIFSKVKVK